jgi:hypothetical protein
MSTETSGPGTQEKANKLPAKYELAVQNLVAEKLKTWQTGLIAVLGILIAVFGGTAALVMSTIHSSAEAFLATKFQEEQTKLEGIRGNLQKLLMESQTKLNELSTQQSNSERKTNEYERKIARQLDEAVKTVSQAKETRGNLQRINDEILKSKEGIKTYLAGNTEFKREVFQASQPLFKGLSERLAHLEPTTKSLSGYWTTTFPGAKDYCMIFQTPYGLLLRNQVGTISLGILSSDGSQIEIPRGGWQGPATVLPNGTITWPPDGQTWTKFEP